MHIHRFTPALVAACLLGFWTLPATGQTPLDTSFKFQGELRLSNVVVNTNQDFVFDVFGTAAGGASLGTNNRPNIPVSRGVFTVSLDFGAGIFAGDKRWLEIRVRDTAAGGAFTTLSPRVELNATPNALFAVTIADDSVTSTKILDLSITSTDIAAGAIGSAKIAANAVSNAKIADNAVTATKIVDGSVLNAKIADGAVTTTKIQDGGVTSADLAAGSVGASKIATDAVSTTKILDGSITPADIGPDVVSSVAGVSNDGGNIGLIAGAGMTITPNDAANTITFATSGDASTVDGIDSLQFLRSDVSDTFSGGFLNLNAGTVLNAVGSAPNSLTIGGANLELSLGDSSADITTVVGQFVTPAINPPFSVLTIDGRELLVGNSATSTIRFFESGTSTFAHRIAWEDDPVDADASLSTCATTGPVNSAMIFDVGDGTASGWAFTNGSDPELVIDEIGTVAADNTVNALGGCDLAETFFGPEGLEAGTLLRADPNAPEAVLPTTTPYDAGMVGIVSTVPALRMNGAATDSLPMMIELLETQRLLRQNPHDEELARRFADLELAVDSWPRGHVDVALVGRVPVKVVGPVRAGEPLTSSAVTGHAMALGSPGPSIGIALSAQTAARGTVLALVQPGWRHPMPAGTEREALTGDDHGPAGIGSGDGHSLADRVAELEQRMLLVAGRDGAAGADGQDGAGASARPDRTITDVVGGTDVRSLLRLHEEVWGDFDGDALDDVAVLDPREGVALLRNLGDGSFADVTAGAGLGETAGTRFVRFADYDLDRRLDLLLVDAAGVAHLYQGAGTGAFTDVTTRLGLDFGQPIVEASFLDYDHDGRDDLRVELADGTIVLHHNRGQGSFHSIVLRDAVSESDVVRANARIADLESQVSELKGLVEALLADRAGSDR